MTTQSCRYVLARIDKLLTFVNATEYCMFRGAEHRPHLANFFCTPNPNLEVLIGIQNVVSFPLYIVKFSV